jgi:hypothetical protein
MGLNVMIGLEKLRSIYFPILSLCYGKLELNFANWFMDLNIVSLETLQLLKIPVPLLSRVDEECIMSISQVWRKNILCIWKY